MDELTSNNILFDSVCETIYSVVNGKVKKKYKYKFIPGFFAFLHTFGRPLNFNPHIHVIIAEGLIDKMHNFKKYNYFNYDALSKCFMKIILDKMETYFGKDKFKDIKNKMYLKYPNDFYNKSNSLCDKLILLVKKEKRNFMRSLLKWHNSILTSFHRFPTRCPKCGFERLVPQSELKKMNEETFKNNKLFICDKCNIRMNPIIVEVDY